MESHAKYRLVGFTVLVLVGAMIFSGLWLTKYGSEANSSHYNIYFKRNSLYGLQINSYVTMKGIKVGSVVDLEISPRNIEEVRVGIQVAQGTPVKIDTQALITRNLLTGLASIDLAKGTQDSPLLTVVRDGETVPIIPEGASELEMIADSVPSVLQSISDVTNRVEALLSEKNLKSVESILSNLDRASGLIGKNEAEIDAIIRNVHAISQDTKEISGTLSSTLTKSSQKVEVMAENLSVMSEDASKLFQDLQARSEQLLASVESLLQVMTRNSAVLVNTTSELGQKAGKTLESFEHPREIFQGPSANRYGPGEK